MSNFLERKDFTMHSGEKTFFKIECDALTEEEINTFALLITSKVRFSGLVGIPRGGIRITEALKKYTLSYALSTTTLIVDDVFTTGFSMEEERC